MYHRDATGNERLATALWRAILAPTVHKTLMAWLIDHCNIVNQFKAFSASSVAPDSAALEDGPAIFHVGWRGGGCLLARIGLLGDG